MQHRQSPMRSGLTGLKIMALFIYPFLARAAFAYDPVAAAGGIDLAAPGFDLDVWDAGMAGVQRSADTGTWLRFAGLRMEHALDSWQLEVEAAGLYDRVDRERLEGWLLDDLAGRYADWLEARLFGRAAATALDGTLVAIDSANRELLYVAGQDGRVVVDASGNPVYRPVADPAGQESDEVDWRAMVDGTTGALAEDLRVQLGSLKPEVLALIGSIGLGDGDDAARAFGSVLDARVQKAVSETVAEMDALASRERQLFVARRTSDVFSLRRSSEDHGAMELATALATEAGQACDAALDELGARLEAASAGSGDLAVHGQEWLQSFREQYDRGLLAWRDAEESFLTRRIEWEADAISAFDDGMASWEEAQETLEAGRIGWEERASALFRSGEEAFASASDELEADIIVARSELERASSTRIAAMTERAEAWASVYTQASEAGAAAVETAGYWLDRLEGAPDGPLDASSADVVSAWLSSVITAFPAGDDRHSSAVHALEAVTAASRYRLRAEEAAASLLACLDDAMGEPASLLSILDETATDALPDDYQLELLRASAIKTYQERRVDVARAVLEYASDTSAGRDTAADSAGRLAMARAMYESALEDYDVGFAALLAAGNEERLSRSSMDEKRAMLAQAGTALADADAAYATILAATVTGDIAFIRDELASRYAEAYGMAAVLSSRDEDSVAVAMVLSAAEDGFGRGYAALIEAVRRAVNGSASVPSLRELSQAAEALVPPAVADGLVPDPDAYGLEGNSPAQARLMAVRSWLEGAVAGQSSADAVSLAHAAAETLTYGVLCGVSEDAGRALEARLDTLSLYGAVTAGDWYAARTGHDAGLLPVVSVLEADVAMAEAGFLVHRVELESAALRSMIAGTGSGGGDAVEGIEAWRLSPLFDGGRTDEEASDAIRVEAALASLDAIRDALETHEADTGDALATALQAIADADPVAAAFLRGEGFFGAAGIDAGTTVLSQSAAAVAAAKARLSAYHMATGLAPCLEADLVVGTLGRMAQTLRDLGVPDLEDSMIGADGTVVLPPADRIVATLTAWPPEGSGMPTDPAASDSGIADRVATLAVAIHSLAGSAPREVAEMMVTWMDAVRELAASSAAVQPAISATNAAATESQISALAAGSSTLTGILRGLDGSSDGLAARSLWTFLSDMPDVPGNDRVVAALEGEIAILVARQLVAFLEDADPASSTGMALASKDSATLQTTIADQVADAFGYLSPAVSGAAGTLALFMVTAEEVPADGAGPGLQTPPAIEGRLDAVRSIAERYAGVWSGDASEWSPLVTGDALLAAEVTASLRWSRTDASILLVDRPTLDAAATGDQSALAVLAGSAALIRGPFNPAWSLVLDMVNADLARIQARADHLAAVLDWYRVLDDSAADVSAAGGHWRTSLAGALDGTDSGAAASADSADSQEEAVGKDCSEAADRATTLLDMTFTTWRRKAADVQDTATDSGRVIERVSGAVSAWLADPESPFDDDAIPAPSRTAAMTAAAAAATWRSGLTTLDTAREDIRRLGRTLAAAADAIDGNADLQALETDVEQARLGYTGAMAAYEAAATGFAMATRQYDDASASVRNLSGSLEEARLSYEKEDAIYRWASTAYLAVDEHGQAAGGSYLGPADELASLERSLARAVENLKALKALYTAGELQRPYDSDGYRSALDAYRNSMDDARLAAAACDAVAESTGRAAAAVGDAWQTLVDAVAPLAAGRPAASSWLAVDSGGHLCLAYSPESGLTTAAGQDAIDSYFESPESASGMSPFMTDLVGLSEWMSSMNFDADTARRWGLARDHVMKLFAESSADFAAFAGPRPSAAPEGQLGNETLIFLGEKLSDILIAFDGDELAGQQRDAYESMGTEERRWFSRYLALQVSGSMTAPAGPAGSGTEHRDAFSWWSLLAEYDELERVADKETAAIKVGINLETVAYVGFVTAATIAAATVVMAWTVPGLLAAAGLSMAAMIGGGIALDGVNAVRQMWQEPMNDVRRQVDANLRYITSGMSAVTSARDAYDSASSALALVTGTDSRSDWDPATLRSSLIAAGMVSGVDLDRTIALFGHYTAETGTTHTSLSGAMQALASWSFGRKDEAFASLASVHDADRQAQSGAVATWREVSDAHTDGLADTGMMSIAAADAFGSGSPSVVSFLRSASGPDRDLLSGIAEGTATDMSGAGAHLRARSAATLVEMVRQAEEARAVAEAVALDSGWNISRRDLLYKLAAWREASGLILARGRADFRAGAAHLRQKSAAWEQSFMSRYNASSRAWEASRDSFDKERLDWVGRAAAVADEAGSMAMMALVGNDAEAAVRRYDTTDLLRLSGWTDAVSSVGTILASAGLAALDTAFGASAGQSATVATSVRLSSGRARQAPGLSAAGASILAAGYAETVAAELAAMQAGMIVQSTRDAALRAVAALEGNLDAANESFSRGMHSAFIIDNGWLHRGGEYRKDVVVHSTVGTPFITESASVAVYVPFVPAPWNLTVDLSDASLSRMNPRALYALVDKARREVGERSRAIFGGETGQVPEGGGDGAGLFGAHTGIAPTMLEDMSQAASMDDMFVDRGSGESGRLLSALYYWSMLENRGWKEAGKPDYEKDLWDDRGDWFQAPNIRGLADMGATAAAVVLSGGSALPAVLMSAAINLTDDAVFGTLDAISGARSGDEALLEFGKSAAMALVTGGTGMASGAAIAAIGTWTTGLKAFASAGIRGAQAGVNAVAGAAIHATAFDTDTGKLVWSHEGFASATYASLGAVGIDSAGQFIGAGLQAGLEGFTGQTFSGGVSLAEFSGAAAGQALSYGIRGTASFNLANLGMFGLTGLDGNAVSGGLLELNVGQGGVSMAIGSGGMDASAGRLLAAAGGFKAAAVNARMLFSGQDESGRYASALRTLASSGDTGDQELFDRVLDGRTDIIEMAESEYVGRTVSVGGSSVILLGGAADRSSRFGINQVLAHEARRDGVVGDIATQRTETVSAVLGHISAAGALAATYGTGSLSAGAVAELDALYRYRTGDQGDLHGILASYDGSDDYWKLTRDGRLINDGEARLQAEIINDDGSQGWHHVAGSETERSVSAALVNYLGQDRAMALLGGSLDNIARYDDQTLRDVLNLDDTDIKAVRANPGEASRIIESASKEQRRKLLGEVLMKNAGIGWDAGARIWEGAGTGLALSAGVIHGDAAIRSISAGVYERFSITAEIERQTGAYDVWQNGIKGDVGAGNTRVSFTKWDLDSGEQVGTIVAGGAWNSVDNSFGQKASNGTSIGTDTRYQIAFGPALQANTIAEGSFDLRLAQHGSNPEFGAVMIFANTETISGDTIGIDGRRPGHPEEYRWLFHKTGYGSSDGCVVYKGAGDTLDQFDRLMSLTASWGLYPGYTVSGMLSDHNDTPYRAGYRTGHP